MGGKEGGLWRLSAASQDAGRRTALGIQGWVRDWDTSPRDSPPESLQSSGASLGAPPSGWFYSGFLAFNVRHIPGHPWLLTPLTTPSSLVYTLTPVLYFGSLLMYTLIPFFGLYVRPPA